MMAFLKNIKNITQYRATITKLSQTTYIRLLKSPFIIFSSSLFINKLCENIKVLRPNFRGTQRRGSAPLFGRGLLLLSLAPYFPRANNKK